MTRNRIAEAAERMNPRALPPLSGDYTPSPIFNSLDFDGVPDLSRLGFPDVVSRRFDRRDGDRARRAIPRRPGPRPEPVDFAGRPLQRAKRDRRPYIRPVLESRHPSPTPSRGAR